MGLKYIKLYENFSEIDLDKIFEECEPYINMLRNYVDVDKLLIRSTRDYIQDVEKFNFRENRKPVDMPPHVHDMLNDMFVERFGWKVRNGVFCYLVDVSKDKLSSTHYGTEYLMFPIGDFKYVFSTEFSDLFYYIKPHIGDLITINDMLDTYIDNNINMVDNDDEISVKCNSYYLINQKYIKEILKRI